MYWECQNYVLAEDGAFLRKKFPSIKVLVELKPSDPPVAPSDDEVLAKQDKPDLVAIQINWWQWSKLINEYTGRKLTMEQDKLPALSGLANSIASCTGDTYHAGLWRSNILSGHYWSVRSFEPHHQCDDLEHDAVMLVASKSAVKFPSEYRAPSWSWAALDAEIEYGYLNEKLISAALIDVLVVPIGENPFGRVKSGWIKLKVFKPKLS